MNAADPRTSDRSGLDPTGRPHSRTRRHRIRRRGGLAWLAAALLLLGACSGDGDDGDDDASVEPDDASVEPDDDPAEALRAALDALGEWEGMSTTVGLDLDDTARSELAADAGLATDDAAMLTDTTLRITSGQGGDGSDVSMAALVDGEPAFEYRTVDGGRVFARIDLDAVADLEQGADLDEAVTDLTEMSTMLGFAEGAEALTSGGWVELVGIDAAMDAVEDLEEDDASEDAAPEPVDDRVLARIEAFLDEDVEVAWVAGAEGEQVRIQTDGAALQTLLDDLSAVAEDQEVVGGVAQDASEGLGITDDEIVTADAWIVDGALSQLAVDITVIEDVELTGEAALVLGFEPAAAEIEVPADATPIDLEEVVAGFFGGMFGGLDGEGGFGDAFPGDVPDDPAGDDTATDEGSQDADGGDEPTPEPPSGVPGGTPGECISAQELEDLEEFAGPEAVEAMRSLIDQGLLELC